MTYKLGVWNSSNERCWHGEADADETTAAFIGSDGWICWTPDGLNMPGACGPERGDEGRALADAALEAWIAKQPREPDLQECRRLLAVYVLHVHAGGSERCLDLAKASAALGLAAGAVRDDLDAIARGER